jgi:hypothetical protein
LPISIIGKADTTGLCDPFKARSDIDAITEDVVVVDDDVSDVDADPKSNTLMMRDVNILPSHALLNFNGTSRGIHRARELDQHAVAGGLDDASAMRGDGGINQRLSEHLELRERALLVEAHQLAITGDIRRHHSRQSSLHALAAQDAPRAQEIECLYNSIMG